MQIHLLRFLVMRFLARLIPLRKAADYTQQTASEVARLDKGKRGFDEDLLLHFGALAKLNTSERKGVKDLMDGLLLMHRARHPNEAHA
jgi:hypothetical protein